MPATSDSERDLRERRDWIERELANVLPPEGRIPVRLTEALRYSVLVGGKRLRPILCTAAAEAAGGRREAALLPALAVELLHTYTLVHDDLPCMDNDLLRRGQPTVHAKYGEALGVLVGDALQTFAFEVLARTPTRAPETLARLVSELATAAGPYGVVGGQVEDIAEAATADVAVIAFVHQHKTADLFRAAVRMGAIAGGASDADVERLGTYGNHLGLAFQIVDDLLDTGTQQAGQPAELSCLRVWSADEARAAAAAHTRAATAALNGLPGRTTTLAALAGSLLGRVV